MTRRHQTRQPYADALGLLEQVREGFERRRTTAGDASELAGSCWARLGSMDLEELDARDARALIELVTMMLLAADALAGGRDGRRGDPLRSAVRELVRRQWFYGGSALDGRRGGEPAIAANDWRDRTAHLGALQPDPRTTAVYLRSTARDLFLMAAAAVCPAPAAAAMTAAVDRAVIDIGALRERRVTDLVLEDWPDTEEQFADPGEPIGMAATRIGTLAVIVARASGATSPAWLSEDSYEAVISAAAHVLSAWEIIAAHCGLPPFALDALRDRVVDVVAGQPVLEELAGERMHPIDLISDAHDQVCYLGAQLWAVAMCAEPESNGVTLADGHARNALATLAAGAALIRLGDRGA